VARRRLTYENNVGCRRLKLSSVTDGFGDAVRQPLVDAAQFGSGRIQTLLHFLTGGIGTKHAVRGPTLGAQPDWA
jgi:hypothetical protein